MRRESGRRPRAEYKETDTYLFDVRPLGYFKRATHKEIRRLYRAACREEEALLVAGEDDHEELSDAFEEYINETYLSKEVLSD